MRFILTNKNISFLGEDITFLEECFLVHIFKTMLYAPSTKC